jgi:hypothetical protein
MREAVATKRSDPNYSQVSGYVPKELALKFRVACTAKEISQSDALAKALMFWLEQNEHQPAKANSTENSDSQLLRQAAREYQQQNESSSLKKDKGAA